MVVVARSRALICFASGPGGEWARAETSGLKIVTNLFMWTANPKTLAEVTQSPPHTPGSRSCCQEEEEEEGSGIQRGGQFPPGPPGWRHWPCFGPQSPLLIVYYSLEDLRTESVFSVHGSDSTKCWIFHQPLFRGLRKEEKEGRKKVEAKKKKRKNITSNTHHERDGTKSLLLHLLLRFMAAN